MAWKTRNRNTKPQEKLSFEDALAAYKSAPKTKEKEDEQGYPGVTANIGGRDVTIKFYSFRDEDTNTPVFGIQVIGTGGKRGQRFYSLQGFQVLATQEFGDLVQEFMNLPESERAFADSHEVTAK